MTAPTNTQKLWTRVRADLLKAKQVLERDLEMVDEILAARTPEAGPPAKKPRGGRQPKALDEALLRRLWPDTTVLAADLAARLGVTLPTMRRHAERLGLPPRPRAGGRRPIDLDEALLRRLWHDPTLKNREIAQRLGLGESTLMYRARQLDPPLPDRRVLLRELRARRPAARARLEPPVRCVHCGKVTAQDPCTNCHIAQRGSRARRGQED